MLLLVMVLLGQARAADDTCSAGGLLYCSASGTYSAAAAGSTGQCLKSNASSAPSWGDCLGSSADTPTTPSAPASGSTTIYTFAVDGGFPGIVSTIDGFMGLQTPVGLFGQFSYYGTSENWDVQCGWPTSWGGTTLMYYRNSEAFQATGTAGSVAWSSASLVGRLKQVTYVTAATTNSAAEIKAVGSRQNVWRGDTAGAGGWLLWIRGGMNDTAANIRFAAGLFTTTSILTTNVDPSTLANSAYFGCDVGQTTLRICTNDNTGSATCSDLGADYPCTTDGAYYDFWLAAAPNGSAINWAIQRLDSAASTGGTITSDLPQNTVQLNWHLNINTGSGSTAARLGFMGTCYAANL